MTTLLQEEPETVTSEDKPVPAHAHRIVLTGFMGAGKTTIGRLLADTLGWQFLDIDHEVEARTGRTVAEIFEAEGEGSFRRLESAAIARALGQRHVVIALGGGAPELLGNRLLLEQTAHTAVVLLDAPLDVLLKRCASQEGAAVRPVLLDHSVATQRFLQRTPLYRRCAHHRIATADQHPQETVQAILQLLGS
jgi:shikimate kinase